MLREQSILRYLGFNTQGDLGPWTFYTSKRKGLIFFQKAPPLEPPSPLQIHQRNKFRIAGAVWRALPPAVQRSWQVATIAAGLRITGYNLFVHWICIQDDSYINTVERQSRIDLVPLLRVGP